MCSCPMCGRYALHAHPEVIALQFGLDAVPSFKPRYNISPGTDVLAARDGRRCGPVRGVALITTPANDGPGLLEPLREGPAQRDLL